MLYSSIKNEKIKEIKKLNQKKYRDKSNLFLIEGEHLVLEAYKTGNIKELILEQDTVLPLDVDTMYVTNDIINYISDTMSPQNIMAVCNKLDEKEDIGNRILILDDINDPGNLGTIIRSAVAFNVDTIVLSKDTVDLYNPKVLRSTQGMLFHINIIRKDLNNYIKELKKKGYQLLSTNVEYGKNVNSISKNEKCAIIMGNEANGVKSELAQLCDDYLYIDMNEDCESLNVAVATSIILYEMNK